MEPRGYGPIVQLGLTLSKGPQSVLWHIARMKIAYAIVGFACFMGLIVVWFFVKAAQPDDYKSLSYYFNGQPIALVDGKAETPAAPGSASKVVTQYFGNEMRGDLNGDGQQDVAFIVTQETGGSGTFFYLLGAIKQASGYKGTNAMLIGDRIAPPTTEFKDGQIIVSFADRKPGEPMSAQPSVRKSLHVKYNETTNSFAEVVQSF